MVKKSAWEKELVYELLFYAFGLLTAIFFWQNNAATFALLVLGWMGAIKLWHTNEDIITYLAAAIAGPLAEIILISSGVWTYANPTAFGIPIWLPLLWGMTGVLLKRLGKTCSNFLRI